MNASSGLSKRKRIAVIGARGFGNYGGFETYVHELAPLLVQKGIEVYCSHEMNPSGNNPTTVDGTVSLYFPFRMPDRYSTRKIFELLYDWYFVMHTILVAKCDAVYCLGTLAGPVVFLPRLFGVRTIVNVDGLEWRRTKLTWIERSLLRFFFLLSCLNSTTIIVDNKKMHGYIPGKLQNKVRYVPYGARFQDRIWDDSVIMRYFPESKNKIQPGKYFLVVARLEPENNIETIVRAYKASRADAPLVIVGGFTSSSFRESILRVAFDEPNVGEILFAGPIYTSEHLQMLREYSLAYVHGHSVGGTNPSLLEAMAAGSLIVMHNNEFNSDVCADSALLFSSIEDLSRTLRMIDCNPLKYEAKRRMAKSKAQEVYQWTKIAEAVGKIVDEPTHRSKMV